ncbi:PAS domain-containing sensor histidine kinase [Nonomuraea harbinensis]|uniref:histidine kinase n=1 Tax=Nonomuraea harbinensis TaxID=1286938 RepID=A0ABW1BPU0_9ACTN|nr:PAS domain-containing sensor histidine kinase [Nonomuraea harbinensis]
MRSCTMPEHEHVDLQLLLQSLGDYAIFMLDPGGRVMSWNSGAERIKGYSADEVTGRHFSIFYPPEDIAAGRPARGLETAAAEGRFEDEGWRVRKDGTRFWANVVITALRDGEGRLRGFGKVTRDMSERRNAERALDERGRLLAHLVQAQEKERRRIAWDVHDDTIQSMVAVGMRLQLLASQLPGDHAEAVLRLNDTVNAAVGRLRNLAFFLHPPGLDSGGLVDTLSGYLEQVVSTAGLTYDFVPDLDEEPPPETAITVFRICQEALTNVRKHAHASSVRVSLASADQGVHVKVGDDGVGFTDPGDGSSRMGHFGLIEMRERAEISGGWWQLHSSPGEGSTVEFWVPAVRPRRS